MLRQIEWGVQDRPITKNGVLSVSFLFFRKFCSRLRTLYKELILCTNHLDVHIHTFRKRWSFVWGSFFPVSILKSGSLILHWSYANIFMADFERKYILPLIKSMSMLYLRYDDEIFMKAIMKSVKTNCGVKIWNCIFTNSQLSLKTINGRNGIFPDVL